jgi:hypothetical protein
MHVTAFATGRLNHFAIYHCEHVSGAAAKQFSIRSDLRTQTYFSRLVWK